MRMTLFRPLEEKTAERLLPLLTPLSSGRRSYDLMDDLTLNVVDFPHNSTRAQRFPPPLNSQRTLSHTHTDPPPPPPPPQHTRSCVRCLNRLGHTPPSRLKRYTIEGEQYSPPPTPSSPGLKLPLLKTQCACLGCSHL